MSVISELASAVVSCLSIDFEVPPMTKTRRPRANCLVFGPLEARWLFSAAWPQLETHASNGHVVAAQVHQPLATQRVSESESHTPLEERETEIELSSLPPSIQRKINEALAGWQPVSAFIQTDEGVTNYVVGAERFGTSVEFKIGLDGELQEVEQQLPVLELPNSIQHWASRIFPGVSVTEVVSISKAGAVSYEMAFETANGDQFEATLQEIAAPSPFPVQSIGSERKNLRAIVETDRSVLAREPNSRSHDTDRSEKEPFALPSPVPPRVTKSESPLGEVAFVDSNLPCDDVTEALGREASPLADDSNWVNEVWANEVMVPAIGIVGTIREWVPFDGETVERGFSQFLDSLNQLLLNESGGWRDRIYQVLPIIYFVIGVQAFALKSLRRKRPELTGPVQR